MNEVLDPRLNQKPLNHCQRVDHKLFLDEYFVRDGLKPVMPRYTGTCRKGIVSRVFLLYSQVFIQDDQLPVKSTTDVPEDKRRQERMRRRSHHAGYPLPCIRPTLIALQCARLKLELQFAGAPHPKPTLMAPARRPYWSLAQKDSKRAPLHACCRTLLYATAIFLLDSHIALLIGFGQFGIGCRGLTGRCSKQQ